MAIKEQKLFFTRHGKYTLWEMLNHLSDEYLEQLLNFVFEKSLWSTSVPEALDEYPSFFFKVNESLDQTQRLMLSERIEQLFTLTAPPKSDFNSFIYQYSGTSFDLASALANLERLQGSHEFEIGDLAISIFPYDEINGLRNVIDLRFSSPKNSYFKENTISSLLNTEIRVYLDLKVMLVTDFSEYTHSISQQKEFVDGVINCVSTHRGALEPVKLSDQTLRSLLLMDQNPSKLTFEIEGRLRVGVRIHDDASISDLVQIEEVRHFYERYSLSLLRIKISDSAEEKFLIIDGDNGKLIGRTRNLEVRDIDAFIQKISVLLEFNYLNSDYLPELKLLARRNLIGTISQKEQIAVRCQNAIQKKLQEITGDTTGIFVKVLKNAFLYCVINHRRLVSTSTGYSIDHIALKYLSQISGNESDDILSTFSSIVVTYARQGELSMSQLMIELDNMIRDQGMEKNASGL